MKSLADHAPGAQPHCRGRLRECPRGHQAHPRTRSHHCRVPRQGNPGGRRRGQGQWGASGSKEINGYPVETLNDPEVLALKNGYSNALSHYLAGFLYEVLGESAWLRRLPQGDRTQARNRRARRGPARAGQPHQLHLEAPPAHDGRPVPGRGRRCPGTQAQGFHAARAHGSGPGHGQPVLPGDRTLERPLLSQLSVAGYDFKLEKSWT